MLNPPYAVLSSGKLFSKTQHEFPKGKSSEDSDAEKMMSEILLEGEDSHQVFFFLP